MMQLELTKARGCLEVVLVKISRVESEVCIKVLNLVLDTFQVL